MASCERPPCPPLGAGRWGNDSLLSHDDTASSLGLSPDEMTDDLAPLEVCRLVIYGFLLPFHLVHTSPIIRIRFRDMRSTRDLLSIYSLLEQQQVRKYFTQSLFLCLFFTTGLNQQINVGQGYTQLYHFCKSPWLALISAVKVIYGLLKVPQMTTGHSSC